MNNVAYAFYFNFFLAIGWMLEMKYGHWIYGYGFMSVGVFILYFWDDILDLVNFIKKRVIRLV